LIRCGTAAHGCVRRRLTFSIIPAARDAVQRALGSGTMPTELPSGFVYGITTFRRDWATFKVRRSIAIVILACAATAFLSARQIVSTKKETGAKVTEELVHVQTSDGITNGGAVFAAAGSSARPIAVIWIHGSQVNFYDPAYVKIGRELAARGFTTITGNTRMHDLGNLAATRGGQRVRGGVYWGLYSEQVRDLAAWIDFAISRGFTGVVLAGHSAGTTAVQAYQAETQDRRVLGLVIASGRVQPNMTPPDPERLAQATKLVGEGLGEALLPNSHRPTSFVSAGTFLDLANMGQYLRDFYGVETANPPVTRVLCPLLAWFGTKESEIGTAADLELLKSTLRRLPAGPRRVDTVMIQNADHMYRGEEAQVAQTIARWADDLVPPSARKDAPQKRE
jgi:pimeloyl-ACP methyl ester carboxylesterase